MRILVLCRAFVLPAIFGLAISANAQVMRTPASTPTSNAPPSQASPLLQQLPNGVIGQPYRQPLSIAGLRSAVTWQVGPAKLPPGIGLDTASSSIVGQPTAPGEFRFSLIATEMASQRRVSVDFVLNVLSGLSIEWKQKPTVQGDAINGQLTVSSYFPETVDLTIIVVAVNEIGKAFALGYQHYPAQKETSQTIPFGMTSMPYGRYIIHADAVAEIAKTQSIYRARMETPSPLTVARPF